MQSKRKSNSVIQNKARQQAEKKHTQTEEHLETKSKQNKTKSKNQKLKWETEIEWTLNKKN